MLPRFLGKIKKLPSGCWIWQSSCNSQGYGTFWYRGKSVLAHRFAYAVIVSEIPPGLELDHLCRTPKCVNPAHLEPVTHRENVKRWSKTIVNCPAGHPYTPDNTYIFPRGRRGKRCRQCHAVEEKSRRFRLKESIK